MRTKSAETLANIMWTEATRNPVGNCALCPTKLTLVNCLVSLCPGCLATYVRNEDGLLVYLGRRYGVLCYDILRESFGADIGITLVSDVEQDDQDRKGGEK